MAQRGARNVGCKRCVRVIAASKVGIFTLVCFSLLVFITQNQIVQLTEAFCNLEPF